MTDQGQQSVNHAVAIVHLEVLNDAHQVVGGEPRELRNECSDTAATCSGDGSMAKIFAGVPHQY